MPVNDTLKPDGSWIVGLARPLRAYNRDITEIIFTPPSLDHIIRWGSGAIVSTMALMAELTGVPEVVLRMLTPPDLDRVMMAFTSILPSSIRDDFQQGKKPFATQMQDAPPGALGDDPIDSRFPATAGPITRFPTPPPSPPMDPQYAEQEQQLLHPQSLRPRQLHEDIGALDVAPPETMRKAIG